MYKTASSSLLQNARRYGVTATASSKKSFASPDLHATKLSNGVQIATWENFFPVSSLSFVVGASSRFETADTFGNSHFLRHFGFKGVKGRTALRLAREFDLNGANLTITANREHIIYSAVFLRDELPLITELVSEIFTKPHFSLHEVDDVKEIVEHDIAKAQGCPTTQLIESLHRAAFRKGLGNSLFAPEVNLECIDSTTLEQFAAKHFVSGNIAVVGSGIDFHDLEHVVSDHLQGLASGKAAPSPNTYFGGEVYQGRFDEKSRVAVGYETKGVFDKDFYSTSLLQKILGGKSSVFEGNGHSLLAQAAGSKASIESFNYTYSDAGLVGFLITAPHGSGIAEVYQKATSQIQKLAQSVSEKDLNRAKNQLKFEYLQSFDSRNSVAQNLGKQLLTVGKTYTGAEFTSNVDKITPADIQRVASRLSQSRPTVVIAADDF